MSLYLFLALFYIICIILEYGLRNKFFNKICWITILILPLFILAAFRAPSVGNDSVNYYNAYYNITQASSLFNIDSRLEKGYVFFNRIIGNLGFNYLEFQIIENIIIYFVLGLTIKKYSKSYALSIYCFLTMRMFFGTMNISRQYLAVIIILCSIESIKKQKPLKFILIIILASSFHTTAIVFLVMYPFSKIRWSNKNILFFCLAGIGIGIFFDKIVKLFINITGKYSGYLTSGYFKFENNTAIYFELAINLSFFLLAIFIRYYKKNNINNLVQSKMHYIRNAAMNLDLNGIWFSTVVLTLICSIAGLQSTIMSRIALYFSVFFVIYIPDILNTIKNRIFSILIELLIVFFLLLEFYIVMKYRPNWNMAIPYNWYWNW